ncbi:MULTISPECIES: peptide deformylase [Streptomyces]|uniref:Peptide deformylase n=2 Tax=Streptomyces TaxID=1883 RepID=V9Z619_9ACTN|nr:MULTISPECIES: peptide deformylase [unclassified Streptomyces]AHE39568.1 Formylmethionine deformylase [Streptomyces sp. F2]KOV62926.1 formylmethionine deformylase [Streptomyces sp. AS58]
MRPSQQMRDLGIVQYGAPVLRDPARPFALPDERETLDTVVGQLLEVMERIRRAHDFSGKGLGLAAPQIGIGRSAAVVQPPGSDPIVLLNPRVTDASEDMDERFEGCLSFFDVRAQVPRPLRITVETMTAAGSTEKAVYERGDARLIAHEIDHLDGLLLMDRMRPGVRPVPVEEYRRTAEATGRPWSYE